MKSNAREMRDLSQEELTAKAAELKKELFNLRFQQAMGQIENPMRLRTLRKDIAKTKTILREKHGRV
ncbi:MAG: ribosomal protein [Nitrospirae bacterium]|jgi:large subunit ribosomal protein L29|nr:ribosomal protein [Nitrospirota bacterium]MBS1127635.1 ribosomal protein [Nitrospirota bacterium]MBS1242271.1 ribosomal protein [Nitrospirota bacterium]